MTEAVVVPIDPALAGRVAEYMHRNMASRFSVAQWLQLYDYPWFRDRPCSGWALVDGDRIVGVLGCVYSRRQIDGQLHTLGNINAWHVSKSYRGHSLRLLYAAMADRDVSITNLTPSKAVLRLFRRFDTLDTHKLFYLPLLRPLAWLFGAGAPIRIGADAVAQAVSGPQRQLFDDHRHTLVEHFLLTAGNRQCYIVARRRIKKRIPFAEVLYISEPALFVEHFGRLTWAILGRLRAPALAFDKRFVPTPPRGAIPVRRQSFLLSRGISPADVDNLYSELCLLPA